MRVKWYEAMMKSEKYIKSDIHGVRINCRGDTHISGRPLYEAVP